VDYVLINYNSSVTCMRLIIIGPDCNTYTYTVHHNRLRLASVVISRAISSTCLIYAWALPAHP